MKEVFATIWKYLKLGWQWLKKWYAAHQEKVAEEKRRQEEIKAKELLKLKEAAEKRERIKQEKRIQVHEELEKILSDEFAAIQFDLSPLLKSRPKGERQFLAEKYIGQITPLARGASLDVIATNAFRGFNNGGIISDQETFKDGLLNWVAQRSIADMDKKEIGVLFLSSFLNLTQDVTDEDLARVKECLVFKGGDCSMYALDEDGNIIPPDQYSEALQRSRDGANEWLCKLLPTPEQIVNEGIVVIGNVRRRTESPDVKAVIGDYLKTSDGIWLSGD